MQLEENTCCSKGCFFNGSKPKTAHESACSSSVLLGLRLTCALYFTGIYVWRFDFPGKYHSLIVNITFMTNYGFFFTWLYFVTAVQDRLLRYYDSSFKHCIQVLGEIALTF